MLMISRGNPSKRVGFPLKTVHWTVFSPHPALVDAKVFRSLRRAAKGAAFGNRKPLKRFDRNFFVCTARSCRATLAFDFILACP